MVYDIPSTLTGVVALVGGLSFALGGWSSLSIGNRTIWVMTQFLSAFSLGYLSIYLSFEAYSIVNHWICFAIAMIVGLFISALVGFLTITGPYLIVIGIAGVLGPTLVILDAEASKVLNTNLLARQEFVIFFILLFTLLCISQSKTNESECHRFKYIIITSVLGGWEVTEAIFRFGLTKVQSPAKLMLTSLNTSKRIISPFNQTNITVLVLVWFLVTFFGLVNQLAMRWGLFCYTKVSKLNQLRDNEYYDELQPGATLAAQIPQERVRSVCENCFATVPADTAFCTECGEAMTNEEQEPNISISQAEFPSVTMSAQNGQIPERWQQIPHRAYLASTSFTDASLIKKGIEDVNTKRSIRFMEKGVTANDGSVINYNDSALHTGFDPSFRSFAASQYSIANRAAEPVETPNIRKYKMSGTGFFHIMYFASGALGIVWIIFLFTFAPLEHPCAENAPNLTCDLLPTHTVASGNCRPSTMTFNPDGVGFCVTRSPIMQWITYCLFLFSEILNYFLGLLFNFSMWRPIRRGACYLNDFRPPLPKEQWPTVDIFLCHFMEPVVDNIKTLKNCLALQYPPELLHIFILDDGYCKSVWDANNHFKVSVNTDIINIAGDLRTEVSKLMYERIVGTIESDEALKKWRRQHSNVRELRKDGNSGVLRRDCAVGSLSDDYDYRDRGIPRVTFVGRMKPEVHHSKAGNINNALFNEGACGKYLVILDNDMKPHPKFLLAVMPFFFSEGESVHGGGRQYSDDISWNQVAYVQTPQYFEETKQLTELGDPCGHKNTIFFDAVQCGRDGYDSAAFAGTNAVFRRQAFDSIGGIQYGTQTEDAYTGNVLHSSGWDSVYFRKDFEGDEKDRIRLCEGSVPETVATSMAQRKRWAKGAIQILLMKAESEVDPDWRPPRVPAPDPKPNLSLARKMFYYDSVLYPFGSIPAMCYIIIAIYYLCTGNAPIYTRGLYLLYTFLPLMIVRWMLNLLANRAVDNNDVWRAQQTWFSYSFITMLAILEAIQARITGKEKSWSNTGAGQKTSWTEIPNILLFFTLCVSQVIALVRFYSYENATAPWNYISAAFFGFWIMTNLYPMVKMSLTQYCGWDHTSATFTANVFGSLILIFVVVFVQLWQQNYDSNLNIAQGQS